MMANDNWDYNYLFDTVLNIIYVSDSVFIQFIENVIHPLVRKNEEQSKTVKLINNHISKDGYNIMPPIVKTVS